MNEVIVNFHFLRPYWLLCLIPAVIMTIALLFQISRANQWHSVIDQKLLPYLIDGTATRANKLPVFGLLIIWVLAAIAIAGPTWEKRPVPVTKSVSAMVILWDLSPSMNVKDIAPSRLARSRLKLMDLMNLRKDGLTALISYAGEAHVVTPLTDDTDTITSLVPGLSPEIMPVQGSNPEMAFSLAIELLENSRIPEGDIVFVTDGIAPDAVAQLVDSNHAIKHRVTIWGIGTPEGAPIPLSHGGFARNSNNEIVVAKLEEDQLSHIAIELGGLYVPFSNDDLDINTIHAFNEFSGKSEHETEREFDLWKEAGPYLLLLLLPIAALSFRRGWVVAITLGVFLYQPETSHALSWQDFWQTKDQQAQEAYKQGDHETAANTFKNPNWKAIADYKNENFEAAQKHFEQGTTAEDAFNLGNTLAQQRDLDGAIKAYEQALERNPDLVEAAENKSMIEQLKKMLEQQQNSDNSNQNSDQNQNGEQGDQSQQGQNNESGEQSDSQNSESQSAENQNSEGEQSGEQQDSSQQNEDGSEQGQQNQDSQEQSGQQSGEQEEQEQSETTEVSTSEEEQQALEKHFGQQNEQEKEAQPDGNEESLSDKSEQQDADQESEKTEKHIAEQQTEQQNQEGEQKGNQPQQIIQRQEKSEKQQALEQWLRKVPDNPSGLMRNKFNHQYKERLRSNNQQRRAPPTGQDEQRW